ncbi:hypothetical protein L3X38_019731 [Prunus dulcis]|uniref:Uncharacterized protein n=1 Tax=Prunus dulcis TaxID=3755 RepID=A0AAD4WE83_PRUDU|nr:hypothetical protein L3X38_019731 [Prunus dulcis]
MNGKAMNQKGEILFGIQNSNNCSEMSSHWSDEVSSDSFLEDLQASQASAVLQCSKVELEDSNGSVCEEDNRNGSGRACAHDGEENRFFVKKWKKRQRTPRDQQNHW